MCVQMGREGKRGRGQKVGSRGDQRVRRKREGGKKWHTLSLQFILGYLNLKATSCYQVLPRWQNVSMDKESQNCLRKKRLMYYMKMEPLGSFTLNTMA